MAKLVLKNLYNDGDIVVINKELYDDVRNILYGGYKGIIYAAKLQEGKWYYYVSAEDYNKQYIKYGHQPQITNFEEWFEQDEIKKYDVVIPMGG